MLLRTFSREIDRGQNLHDTHTHTAQNDNLLPLVHLQAPDEEPREDGEEEIDDNTENWTAVSIRVHASR